MAPASIDGGTADNAPLFFFVVVMTNPSVGTIADNSDDRMSNAALQFFMMILALTATIFR